MVPTIPLTEPSVPMRAGPVPHTVPLSDRCGSRIVVNQGIPPLPYGSGLHTHTGAAVAAGATSLVVSAPPTSHSQQDDSPDAASVSALRLPA